MRTEELIKYAEMIVRQGVNIQPGQKMLVRAPIDAAPLVHKVVEVGYQSGASHVMVDWSDEELQRIRYDLEPEESLSLIHEGRIRDLKQMLDDGAAAVSIVAPRPEVMRGVNTGRAGTFIKANNAAMRPFNQMIQSSHNSWTIAVYPTPEWARVMFPDLTQEEANAKLWESIKVVTRMDQADPVAFWKGHVDFLIDRTKWLNERQFASLHYTSSGTDLTVELAENHIWVGGGLENAQGTFFLPNLPTEEVFTTPKNTGVNGVVRSTKPFLHNGQFVDNFTLTFKDGRVVEATAEVGEENLNSILNTDEGARYLGEVALVPHSSPISQLGVVFQNTLLDENAACHFALGSCYTMCVQGGNEMSAEEREAKGMNSSLTHVDFMIGSADLDIDATTQEGEIVPLMRGGEWVI